MRFSWVLTLTACSALSPDVGDAAPPPVDTGPEVIFSRDIRPLMDREPNDPAGPGCKFCHYSTEKSHMGLDVSGLDLATLGGLRRGGNNTQQNIVIPYDDDGSAIIQKLYGTFTVGERMPRSGPPYWTDDEIELVETWILQGAKGDDSE